jgi:hypothetical protein
LLSLAACGESAARHNAQILNGRLQAGLAPDLAAGRATLQPLPDGAQVTLAEQTLFPNGGAQLDDRGRFILASVIEGLLDPRILRIDLAQSPATPPDLQQARLRAVRQFFDAYLVGLALQPAPVQSAMAPQPVAATSQGTTVTVTVVPG